MLICGERIDARRNRKSRIGPLIRKRLGAAGGWSRGHKERTAKEGAWAFETSGD